MRRLLCEGCGIQKAKQPGVRRIYVGKLGGEPDEWERIIWGRAREPQTSQRYIRAGDTTITLAPGQYDCDFCNAPIKPGERCVAWSAWVEGRSFSEGDEPAVWEDDFLVRE
jgi:hypothetical protein